jgi:hypothetical protein
MSRTRGVVLVLGLLLAGCAAEPEALLPAETLVVGPLALTLEAEGQVRAVKAMPLLVPGQQWSQRQLVWMKADGSRVESGELVARFVAAQGQLELDKALLDLQRNALARSAKQDELGSLQGRVEVDLSQVGIDLAIARRYADADLAMFARNQILDALQDEVFLGAKRGVLEWRRDQATSRGDAELGVLDAQRASFDLNAQNRRQDLDALELRASNAGVLVHAADWSGEKPKLGATLWAGREFASLPDPSTLEVELSLPQLEAQGIIPGVEIELHPVGRPEQVVASEISWIASAAAVRGRGNPVKYLRMRATLPSAQAQQYGWVPGQGFRARIHIGRSQQAISVPNVALGSAGGRSYVHRREGGAWVRRDVTLGARGPARSEVLEGLAGGDVVLLTPAALPPEDT